MNKVIISGRLGQDPEVKYTKSGDAVCSFTVATTENWLDKNKEKQERTEWHRVVAWKKQAELCGEFIKKGSQVLIEGKIGTRSWEDKEGNKRYTTEITIAQIEFMGLSGATQNKGTAKINPGENFSHDEIPF